MKLNLSTVQNSPQADLNLGGLVHEGAERARAMKAAIATVRVEAHMTVSLSRKLVDAQDQYGQRCERYEVQVEGQPLWTLLMTHNARQERVRAVRGGPTGQRHLDSTVVVHSRRAGHNTARSARLMQHPLDQQALRSRVRLVQVDGAWAVLDLEARFPCS